MRGASGSHPARPSCQSSGSATSNVSAFVSIVQRVLVADENKERRVKTVLPVEGSQRATQNDRGSVPRQPPGGVRSEDLLSCLWLLIDRQAGE